MDEITKNQLNILQKIQEKVMISKTNEIILRLDEIEGGPGNGIAILNKLQRENLLKVFNVEKRTGDEKTTFPLFDLPSLPRQNHREEIDYQNLEKNGFLENDILKIKIFPTFYEYFSNFCQESSISIKPEPMLIEIFEDKEIKSFKAELKDEKIQWRCYICRLVIDSIDSENIESYLIDFRNGNYKNCKKGHRNLFKLLDGKLQFLTIPFSLEELKKYKLMETAIDKGNNESTLESRD